MLALDQLGYAARGIGLTAGLVIVIGRAFYRRARHRAAARETEQANPFGDSG
ncbi:MAG TPA: hypothetical protein VHY83_03285 [Solirubrobacteraceae bacterium]|jgi:hypothetical protein|nr:hypothetical protein [Solirubrobacteraceae bacterium]